MPHFNHPINFSYLKFDVIETRPKLLIQLHWQQTAVFHFESFVIKLLRLENFLPVHLIHFFQLFLTFANVLSQPTLKRTPYLLSQLKFG